MDPILTAAGAIAGKAVFGKTVNTLIDHLRDKTKKKLKHWNTERKIDNLYAKIYQFRNVKTIWQVDKAIDLTEFYVDSNFKISYKRCTVRRLSDFKIKGNILVEGIAGQGKSIFLRYLCAVELERADYIPIFVELRRIDKDHSLMNRIFAAFDALGLKIDDDLIDALASSGKILLLLDAFDEVQEDLKAAVVTDIEDLAYKYENLRIVITARPEQNIKASAMLSAVSLDNLNKYEYPQVIKKLCGDENQKLADDIISHIKTKAHQIEELLMTPLMVTLLILQYKSYKKLPDTLSEFYDSLFYALLQRHDGTKPGFTRERRCDLNDNQYRNVFEAFCIISKKHDQQTYDQKTIYQITEDALKDCRVKANPEDYIKDLNEITCLILKEALEYRFIHKTVPEYYTASYVKRKPEHWAEKLYTKLRDPRKAYKWQQELLFLNEVDEHRYNKYYFLHLATVFLGISIEDLKIDIKFDYLSLLRRTLGHEIYFTDRNFSEPIRYIGHINASHYNILIRELSILIGETLISNNLIKKFFPLELWTEITEDMRHCPKRINLFRSEKFTHYCRFERLVSRSQHKDEILSVVKNYIDRTFIKARSILNSIKVSEDDSMLDDLI